MTKPLAIDLFCGLGGWTEGLLAEGYYVVGFDIERHRYPRVIIPSLDEGAKSSDEYADSDPENHKQCINRMRNATKYAQVTTEWMEYPAQLVIQDVLTLHGKQFKDAALIVASPPCQAYSYRAMPWKRAKALPPPDNTLFEACFRIQREAIEAAGRHIPLVVENVRGAQKWVGRSRWNFGSFHLWGDVPALMPIVRRNVKVSGFRFDGSVRSFQSASVEAIKNNGGSWFNIGSPGQKETNRNPVHELIAEGVKNKDVDGYERDHPEAFGWKKPRTSSHSKARKAASAMIAKIPLTLAQHIARVYKPETLSHQQKDGPKLACLAPAPNKRGK